MAMAYWLEAAAPAVRDEFMSLFVHHDRLKVTYFDDDNETVHMRTPDGTFVIFDILKAEARGTLLDDDAAVKFFAHIIKGLRHKGHICEMEISWRFR